MAFWLFGMSFEPILGRPVPLAPTTAEKLDARVETIAGFNAQAAGHHAEFTGYLEEGLKLRLNGFVWEFGGAATYAALTRCGFACESVRVRVCPMCWWVFDPEDRREGAPRSRKRTAQLCHRCGDRAKRPPTRPAAAYPLFGGERRQVEGVIYGPGVAPRPDDEPSNYWHSTREIVDWLRVERVECSCGRVFYDVREMSRRGPRRRTCRNCQHGRRVPHEYLSASGAPLTAVSFVRPLRRGEEEQGGPVHGGVSVTLRPDADGVLRTSDGEFAEILNRMTELKRVAP